VAAAAEIAEFGLLAAKETVVLLGFVLIGSLGVLTPLVLTVALGDRSRELLEGVRAGWPGTARRSWPCSSSSSARS
jgi:hypothetical protein